MILHVTNTKPLRDYRLWLQFDDGTEGYADLSGELWGTCLNPSKTPLYLPLLRLTPCVKQWLGQMVLI